jgi:hypothetical protein
MPTSCSSQPVTSWFAMSLPSRSSFNDLVSLARSSNRYAAAFEMSTDLKVLLDSDFDFDALISLVDAFRKDRVTVIRGCFLGDINKPWVPMECAYHSQLKRDTPAAAPKSFLPLTLAACFGSQACIQGLLEARAEPDVDVSENPDRASPLMALQVACANGHLECARLLLDANANVNGSNTWFTPLLVACENGHADCVELLIRSNASLAATAVAGPSSRTYGPLSAASCRNHANCIRVLLDAGANPNGEHPDDISPLIAATGPHRHWIERHGKDLDRTPCVRLLLAAGVSRSTMVEALDEFLDMPPASAKLIRRELKRGKGASAQQSPTVSQEDVARAEAAAAALLAEEAAQEEAKSSSKRKARRKAKKGREVPSASDDKTTPAAATSNEDKTDSPATLTAQTEPVVASESLLYAETAPATPTALAPVPVDESTQAMAKELHELRAREAAREAEREAELREREAELRAREAEREQMREQLICPITCELMRNPVTAADGQTYERSAIEAWFARSGPSPLSPYTNEPLKDTSLRPNIALRSVVRQLFRDEQ